MDEARAVLLRLERIERLDRGAVPPSVLLAELRQLVTEAEAWVRVEPGRTERAESAIDHMRELLGEDVGAVERQGRTLLA